MLPRRNFIRTSKKNTKNAQMNRIKLWRGNDDISSDDGSEISDHEQESSKEVVEESRFAVPQPADFNLTRESRFNEIGGVPIDKLKKGVSEIEWEMKMDESQVEKLKTFVTSSSTEIPDLEGIEKLHLLRRGRHLMVTDYDIDNEVEKEALIQRLCAPEVIEEPTIISKCEPIGDNMMRGEIEIKMKYSAPTPKHVISWFSKGKFEVPGMRIGEFEEFRKQVSPETYTNLLKFKIVCEDLYALSESKLAKMVELRCRIYCNEDEIDTFVNINFENEDENEDGSKQEKTETTSDGKEIEWVFVPVLVNTTFKDACNYMRKGIEPPSEEERQF